MSLAYSSKKLIRNDFIQQSMRSFWIRSFQQIFQFEGIILFNPLINKKNKNMSVIFSALNQLKWYRYCWNQRSAIFFLVQSNCLRIHKKVRSYRLIFVRHELLKKLGARAQISRVQKFPAISIDEIHTLEISSSVYTYYILVHNILSSRNFVFNFRFFSSCKLWAMRIAFKEEEEEEEEKKAKRKATSCIETT